MNNLAEFTGFADRAETSMIFFRQIFLAADQAARKAE
jgi:hypothetical protein